MTPMLLTAAAWAGVLSLDFTGIGPFMISQPLICGPVFGWAIGQLAAGLILGAIVQLLWMDVTPVGVGIPYDTMAVTLLAIYWAGQSAHPALSQIVLSLLFAVPFGFLFRWADQWARRLNTRIARRIDAVADRRLPWALALGIAAGLGWSWLRYAVLYGLLFWAGGRAWRILGYFPKMTWFDQGLTMAVLLLPVAGMGVTLELFMSESPEQRWAAWRPFKGSRAKAEAK